MKDTRANPTPLIGHFLIAIGGGISLVAAVISIKGMGVVFAEAATTVMVLMTSLELGKLAAAASVHLHGRLMTPPIRLYLTVTAVALCMITSLGIYSLLTHGWATSQSTVNQIHMDRALIENRIMRAEQREHLAKDELARLDAAIDVFLKFDRATQAETIRTKQYDQRQHLNSELESLGQELNTLQTELTAVIKHESSLTAKTGVINHIAKFVGTTTDSAATIFVLIVVGVADPLAVLLLVTGLDLLRQHHCRIDLPQSNYPTEASKSERHDQKSIAHQQTPNGDSNEHTKSVESGSSQATLKNRLLDALEGHENLLENSEGDRFLRAPGNTIKALLLTLAPEHVSESGKWVSAIDVEGLPARQMRIDGERFRAIRLPPLQTVPSNKSNNGHERNYYERDQ